MIRVYKSFVFCFFSFLFVLEVTAQHEQLLDSLKPLTSYERRRVVFGYTESISDSLASKERKEVFFKQVKQFALNENDIDLLKEINFMKKKQISVMDFHRSEREEKLLLLIEKNKNTKHPSPDDLFFLGFCYHELGQINFQNGQYAQAFINDLKALEIYQQIGYQNVPNIGKVLHEIALHYYFFKDYHQVIELMRASLKLPPFSKGLDMQRYNNLGMSYMNLGIKDSAVYFLNKGIEAAQKYNSEVWLGLLNGNLAELYYKEKDYQKSYIHFRENFKYNYDQINHINLKMNSYTGMVKIYLKLDSVWRAEEFLEMSETVLTNFEKMEISYLKARNLGDKQQFEVAKRRYFEVKIDYLKIIGDFKKALIYQDSLMVIRKEIEEKYNSAVSKMASDQLTIQNKKLLLVEKEQEKTKQRLLYIILISGVLIISGVLYFYMFKSKQKKKRQSERLIAQNKIAILEKKHAQKELESARKEIHYFVSKINEHNNIINQLEQELEQMKSFELDQQKQVNQALYNLKSVKILTDEDWYEFQENFQAAFPELTNALKSYTPVITTSEKRYLMLAELGFNNKEMARALGVSDAAIRVTWARVRKKLNGTLEDTPQSIIKEIMENSSKEQILL